MAEVNTSGVYRNRVRLVMDTVLKPQGFIFDDSRMPSQAVDFGTSVIAGSVWDGDNRAAAPHFHIAEISGVHNASISGTLEMSDYKSHLTPGLAMLQAGIGDNADCRLSGIEVVNSNLWRPIVENGIFFDLDKQLFLHSSGALESTISGTDLRTALAFEPQPPYPITMATFFMDKWGKAHVYEKFNHKVRFTSWSGISTLDTLETLPNSSPPLYRPAFSGIRWYNVDTTKFEFMVDRTVPEIIRSRNITSGVHVILRKVPYARDKYQMPLVPIQAISGTPIINVYGDIVKFTNGIGTVTMEDYGQVANVVVTSGDYVRLSGRLTATATFIETTTSVALWPGTGTILIDDMVTPNNEQLAYISAGTSGFLATSGIRNASGIQHREGSQIRWVVSGITQNGLTLSGITHNGDHYVNYTVQMSGTPTYDAQTGLMTLSGVENVARADLDLTYYRGISLCYEPSGLLEYNARPALNLNPLIQGNVDGSVWFSTYPLHANSISVVVDKKRDIDNIIGPVYAGNDFLSLTATVKDRFGAPVPNETVGVSLDNVHSIGKIDGYTPLQQDITKTTNSRGEARFVYTPPDSIHGLGYFTKFANIVNTSGLEFDQTFELKEIFVSGIWNTMTFAVFTDDVYDIWTETSGSYSYSADGRFEIISVITGGSLGTYATLAPVKPTLALDMSGQPLVTSGQVKTLVYTAGQIPNNQDDIGAFFVSAEKHINIGVVAPDSQAASRTLKLKIGIPQFMKGEMFFGALEDVDTTSLDSLAYLTINPYTMGFINEHRFDPRQLGNVFRVQGTKSDEYVRNKFYLIPDWQDLHSAENNDETNKFFSFRNRFILEI